MSLFGGTKRLHKKEEKLKSLNATERTFKIGIMAGASTPNESIANAVEKLKEMC